MASIDCYLFMLESQWISIVFIVMMQPISIDFINCRWFDFVLIHAHTLYPMQCERFSCLANQFWKFEEFHLFKRLLFSQISFRLPSWRGFHSFCRHVVRMRMKKQTNQYQINVFSCRSNQLLNTDYFSTVNRDTELKDNWKRSICERDRNVSVELMKLHQTMMKSACSNISNAKYSG